MPRVPMRQALLIAAGALVLQTAAVAQTVRPGSVVRINPPTTSEVPTEQPDKAYKPKERDEAMAKKPVNGCPCSSNNRCSHSLDFNYCIAADGSRVYQQRYWGQ